MNANGKSNIVVEFSDTHEWVITMTVMVQHFNNVNKFRLLG